MRWFASLFALALTMALFHRLTEAGPLEARATLALGFLLLTSLLGGDLSRRWRLPRITGYLLVGFCVGPAWLGLVREDEVTALRFVADAALALLALAAGSELRLELLRASRVVLTRLAFGAIVFPFVAVSAVMLSVTPWFPLTVHQSLGDGVAVALVLGTLAAAASPAVTVALIGETGARGPFARTILGVTIVQDVIVVLLLALVLTLGKAVASPGALNVALAGAAAVHLFGSVAAGLILGVLLGLYMRLIRRGTAVFLFAAAFLTAAVTTGTGLETMLIGLAAGFTLENFSRAEGERLRADLQRSLLPVEVVFFAIAGAGLQLQALGGGGGGPGGQLWPWLLLIIGLRFWSLRAGLQWAGRHPLVTGDLARNGWMGLVSQAGTVLGLAQIARRAFPEWGVSLEALLVAMIGVHEVAGPMWFRRALLRVGEVTEGEHVAAGPQAHGSAVAAARGGL